MKKSNIAQNIRELRVLKGLSQEKLADLAQINLRTVQRIENNETEPRGHSLLQIAKVLNITPEELGVSAGNPAAAPTKHQDKTYPAYLNLSALSFLFFPLLGIVVPLILWMVKRGQSNNIDKAAKRLLIFQILWCILLASFYVSMFNNSFSSLSFIDEGQLLLIVVVVLYATNIIFIVVNAFRSSRDNVVKNISLKV